MSTNAIKAHGASIVFDGQTIGEVMSISGSGRSRTIIRVFTCDSADEVADKIRGGIDEGQISTRLVYDGSAGGVYDILDEKFHDGVKGTLLVTYSDGSSASMSAIIAGLGVPNFGDAEGTIVETEVTWDISGAITFADAAGSTTSASPSTSVSSSASASPSSSAS